MRRPDCGPFGETFLEASAFAMVAAFFVNNLGGGNVETVFTSEIHLLFFLRADFFREFRTPCFRIFHLTEAKLEQPSRGNRAKSVAPLLPARRPCEKLRFLATSKLHVSEEST